MIDDWQLSLSGRRLTELSVVFAFGFQTWYDMTFQLKLSTEILNNLEALKAMWLIKKTNAAIKKEKSRSGEESSGSTDWNRWVAMMDSVQGQDAFSTFEETHKKRCRPVWTQHKHQN